MIKVVTLSVLTMAVAGTAGCASNQSTPLVFGQQQTVGISIGAGASEQGADFVLGYKDKNVAIIPVTLATSENSQAQIISEQKQESGADKGVRFKDALSVLGQFEANTSSTSGDVGLGKFFATGAAAKTLADGFKKKLEGEGN
ncbi:hypothetical protein [Alteromonas sp. CYL-A6]|uniref:hypothetical protein n=1 Tax=Alteromonas nitratireducens TaxID=3390813 RepID=UPI0034B7E8D3